MNKKFLSLIIAPFFYWIIFFLIPYKIVIPQLKDGGWILLYLIIIPFIYVIFYKFAKPQNKKEKLYLIFSFIIPFIIIYWYLLVKILNSFNPLAF